MRTERVTAVAHSVGGDEHGDRRVGIAQVESERVVVLLAAAAAAAAAGGTVARGLRRRGRLRRSTVLQNREQEKVNNESDDETMNETMKRTMNQTMKR